MAKLPQPRFCPSVSPRSIQPNPVFPMSLPCLCLVFPMSLPSLHLVFALFFACGVRVLELERSSPPPSATVGDTLRAGKGTDVPHEEPVVSNHQQRPVVLLQCEHEAEDRVGV